LSAKDAKINNLKKEIEKTETVENTDLKTSKGPAMMCMSYGMLIECTGEVIEDTVCYGGNSGNATYQDAWNCMTTNGQLANEYFCG